MLPALGGGSSLRAYSSWRFRDQNSMLLQGEWRIMINRYLDLAFFYDTGKVAATTSDLDFNGMKDDFGVGVRFHGPFDTPLRVELAKGREGFNIVFSSSAVF
jgi:outer membrane translocation and assembly module TamA